MAPAVTSINKPPTRNEDRTKTGLGASIQQQEERHAARPDTEAAQGQERLGFRETKVLRNKESSQHRAAKAERSAESPTRNQDGKDKSSQATHRP